MELSIPFYKRISFNLLKPSQWGFSKETTDHCKCVRYKALFVSIGVVGESCYIDAVTALLLQTLNGSSQDNGYNQPDPNAPQGGIRLEFEE